MRALKAQNEQVLMDKDSELMKLRQENKKLLDEVKASDESYQQMERNKKQYETELLAEIAQLKR